MRGYIAVVRLSPALTLKETPRLIVFDVRHGNLKEETCILHRYLKHLSTLLARKR